MELLAIGNAELMHGFSLLGIKTYADLSPESINRVLAELEAEHSRALVYIQQDLAQEDIPMINRLRKEGGNILICEIPSLQQVDDYQPAIAAEITRVLGATIGEQYGC